MEYGLGLGNQQLGDRRECLAGLLLVLPVVGLKAADDKMGKGSDSPPAD
jgi:hypothetical protein